MLTPVLDLNGGKIAAHYDLEPMEAVIAAYAQFERKDFNTWDYESNYYPLLRVMQHSVSCGNYAALTD